MASVSVKDEDLPDVVYFRFLDENGRISKESIKNALKPPYPAKYYWNVILFILALIVFLLWNYGIIPGNKLGFFCRDPIFSHKYEGDTISATTLGLGIASLPVLVWFSVERVRQGSLRKCFSLKCFFHFHLFAKQFIIGVLGVGIVAEIAKTIVGEHRPHFFDTCRPDTNVNCTAGSYVSSFTCTNTLVDRMDLIDSSRSFPSGHSALGWFTAIFCAYVVQRRLPSHIVGTSIKLLMLGICVSFGLVCSLSRITDRRHHWWDVLAGTALGILGAAHMIRITERHYRILKEQLLEAGERDIDEV